MDSPYGQDTTMYFIMCWVNRLHTVCVVLCVYARDVPDIRFRLAGYPTIFKNPVLAPVPAKTVPGTEYLSRIVIGPFWQLVHQ